jgi:hypothetical protein
MAEFEQVQKIWKLQKPTDDLPDAGTLLSLTRTTKNKLVRQVALQCVIFLLVTVYTIILQRSLALSETARYAIYGLVIACVSQSLLNGYAWRALMSIDELQKPVAHASAWEHYYTTRIKLVRISGPVYFLLFNICMGVFLIDVGASYPVWLRVLVVAGYITWLVVGWFIVRKKVIYNECQRITGIINNLKGIARDLNEGSSRD